MSQRLIANHAKVIPELIYSRFFISLFFASLSTILSVKTPHLYKGEAKEEAGKKAKLSRRWIALFPARRVFARPEIELGKRRKNQQMQYSCPGKQKNEKLKKRLAVCR
jgi:hypothetical protein